ncbi:MAG: hypothetical protein CSB46_07095 [Micrococcales bacterium]|nr:MAG: hypothetical protein CSB46_07095 [Micrococcales bacterium]
MLDNASTSVDAPDTATTAELLALAVTGFGGTRRDGQVRMAELVEQTLTDGGATLVQAGTGTGKSLAYLVPMVRHAVATGVPGVVSTATLALQTQLIRGDLPRLSEALKPVLGRPIRFGLIKGRSNYLCPLKLAGGFPDDELFDPTLPGTVLTAGPSSRLGEQVVRVREWAQDTQTGDRDDLDPGVPDRAWRQVSVNARECVGPAKCAVAADCFCDRARAAAREADVIVTNHAVLAIDAFEERGLLPQYRALVVDEAHELADRVTTAVSAQLTATMVSAAGAAAAKNGRTRWKTCHPGGSVAGSPDTWPQCWAVCGMRPARRTPRSTVPVPTVPTVTPAPTWPGRL